VTEEPVWLSGAVVLALHDEQLAEHGGASGVRDEGLLESALSRPQNLFHYGAPSLAELAACYAFGLVRNHPFVDGNKRASLVATELFLDLNGYALTATDEEVVLKWLALAAGDCDEPQLADWLGARLQARP
jgi:death-on-curing protein